MKKTPYQFALVGMPGKGKTMSFRNMNPKTCGFVNMEGKPLPFINNFVHYSTPNSWQECYQKLIEYAKNDEITEVVLDSFSGYTDSLVRTARETKKGYDIWSFYNDEIGKLMFLIKKYPKDIIVTAHCEWIEVDEGLVEKVIAVKAKEWRGKIEKEFTVVNFTDMKIVDGKRIYQIVFNSDGRTSAKTPPIFLQEGEDFIENDYVVVLERVRKILNDNKRA